MLIRNKFNGFSFDGSRRAYMGGGGGGGGQPAPSSQRVEQTSIPDYARPYVENMLGRTAALTDINQNPFQPFSGQRVAGFTPMQAQGFGNVANQQVAGQIGEGSNIASQVGQTAMGAFGQGQQLGQAAQGYGGMGAGFGAAGVGLGQQAASMGPQAAALGQRGADMSGMGFGAGQRFENMATDPGAQRSFMSPYMQNVVDFQKQNAIRDFDIAQQGRNAQAVSRGAFGGSRAAVADAEANRALMNQLGGIQATGTQQAFADAQRQMQFGSDLGLRGMQAGFQGLQTGLQGLQGQQDAFRTGLQGTAQGIQGAQTGLQGIQGATAAGQYGLQGLGESTRAAQLLGQLGQAQFGQQRDITNDMLRAGAVQQGQQQQGLDVEYQDFLKSQNFPYQQLAFGSDMLRGLPLSQTAGTFYNAPPSQASQLGGLGTTALGIYGMSGGFKANGGMVGKGYAQGGQVGYAKGGDISMLSTEQLTKLLESPNLSPMEVAMVEEQLMLRRRMESNPEAAGIMAPRQQSGGIGAIPTGDMVPEQMAGGGIVAFKEGGDTYQKFLESEVRKSIQNQMSGNAFARSDAEKGKLEQAIAARQERAPYEALTMAGLGTMAGSSQYGLTNLGLGATEGLKSYMRSNAADTADRQKMLEQQVLADRAEDARRSTLTGQMQGTLGQIYNKQATLEAAAARRAEAGAGKDERNLLRAAALVGSDPTIKSLQTQLEKSGYQPGSPEYNYYEQRIAERQNQIYKTVGVTVPEVTSSNIPFPKAEEKPGLFERIFGGSKTSAASPKPTSAALPMPKSKGDLVKNSVYNTARGPATWDGSNFVATGN